MLNINYSSLRKFLISLGINLMFYGFLIYYSAEIFIVGRLDQLVNFISISNDDVIKNFIETNYKIIDGARTVITVGERCVIVGAVLLIAGLSLWIIESNKNKKLFNKTTIEENKK